MNHIGYDAAFQVVQLLPCIDSYLVKRFIFEYGVAYEDVVPENKTKRARFYIFLVAGRIQEQFRHICIDTFDSFIVKAEVQFGCGFRAERPTGCSRFVDARLHSGILRLVRHPSRGEWRTNKR